MTFDMSSASVGFAREALLAGDAAAAIGALQSLPSRGAEANYWLASALIATGEAAAAALALDAARLAHTLEVAAGMAAETPRLHTDAEYAASVATKLYGGQNVAMSAAVWSLALQAGHSSPTGWLTYALALQHQGRAEEAIALLQQAVTLWPSPVLHQFMLYPHFLIEDGRARYTAEARRWAALYAPEVGAPIFHNASLKGRRLRVGYVAPSFAGTQIRQFIAPILDAHDRGSIDVFLYPAKAETEAVWTCPLTIRGIGHLSDADAAALIRADQIDVLIDAWGHSAGSRLAMFAHRAAPVQAAWLNYIQTTGLRRMDYVLHADQMASPGDEALFTEDIVRIGPTLGPFRAAPDRPASQPTPALATGRVTFGSFNHPAKLSDATIRAWSGVLRGRPGSRLVLKYGYFTDPVLRRATQARFAGHGVEPERIEFRGHSTGQGYLQAFHEIDLALDPSPAPGGTTTCDALANGVPVLTLRGPDFYSRIGVCGVEGAGAPELVAESWDDYVAKAVALTADLTALDRLRARIRPGMDTGPYADDAGFTRRLEAAFQTMFTRWCNAQGDGAEAVRGAA